MSSLKLRPIKNMKNSIITIVLVIAGVFILMWWGKSVQLVNSDKDISGITTELGNQGSLSTDEKVYDFGIISMKDGNVSKIFKITNNSESDVNLKSITTSCMCTTAFIINNANKEGPFEMEGMGRNSTKEILKPGESRDIEVVYDPKFHGPAGVGFIDRFVKITDHSGNSLQLEIRTTVTP